MMTSTSKKKNSSMMTRAQGIMEVAHYCNLEVMGLNCVTNKNCKKINQLCWYISKLYIQENKK